MKETQIFGLQEVSNVKLLYSSTKTQVENWTDSLLYKTLFYLFLLLYTTLFIFIPQVKSICLEC